MKKINFKRYKNLIENIIFIFSLMLAYILQTSCNFLFIYDRVPIIIIAVVLSIAMFKNVVVSCVYSLFAGILCDMALNIPVGVSCFVFVIVCETVSLLTIYCFKTNLSSFSFFVFIFALTEILVANIFRYQTISLLKLGGFYLRDIIIFLVVTYFVSLPVFLFFSCINKSLSDKDIFFTKK